MSKGESPESKRSPPLRLAEPDELLLDDPISSEIPLSESMSPLTGLPVPGGEWTESSFITTAEIVSELPTRSSPPRADTSIAPPGEQTPILLGETLQLVHYARRGDTLLISGVTPHGRRLTFEQREDREGWYVVAAGRRRRPTEREIGLVVATITQEMEAALLPERQAEVRSAYRLAAASDQPGMKVQGLESYRDLLLDEAARFVEGQIDRLSVIAVDYQAFKRFANRHGHRIGAAFVQALGERLHFMFSKEEGVHIFHKSGKSFRIVAVDRSHDDIRAFIDRVITDETRQWLVERVWGQKLRTHPDEVHFHIGVATTSSAERHSDYAQLAQFLSDNAYRASKLGQLRGHSSLALAKTDYRTTVYQWSVSSENELQELASSMDDGPADVMAEMFDYLHELRPADLEGMAVAGDLNALIFSAIARDGFWQGTTAMRIAGERLLARFMNKPSDDSAGDSSEENDFVGGFDLGDEFYGMAIEADAFYFIRGDINSAGATRVKAGLEAVHRAVGWRRADGGGVVGRFIAALEPPVLEEDEEPEGLLDRICTAADEAFEESCADFSLHVNDAVDIGDFLFDRFGDPVSAEDLVEGARLELRVPGQSTRSVEVLERRSGFTLRLLIDGIEFPAVFAASDRETQVKLRIRQTVASAAICALVIRRSQLIALLEEIREDNGLPKDAAMDVLGFLRHITDILLEDEVKRPAKVRLALGATYSSEDFVRCHTLEDVREGHPGLFYEAVHQDLLDRQPGEIDRQLQDLVARTMLVSARPLRGV